MEGFLQISLGLIMLFFCVLCTYSIIRMLRDTTENREQPEREPDVEHIDSAELSEIITRTATALADAKGKASRVQNSVSSESQSRTDFSVANAQNQGAESAKRTEAGYATMVQESIQNEMSKVDELVDIDNAVVFSKYAPTMEEKYAALSPETKAYFDEIVSHTLSKEGAKECKCANYYDYKIGSYRLLRITVKRGEILCELRFIDRQVLDYLSESEVKIKQSASSVRVTSPAAVAAVRDGIDLVFSQIVEDIEYKKNLAREKRRERQRRAKEEEKSPAAAAV